MRLRLWMYLEPSTEITDPTPAPSDETAAVIPVEGDIDDGTLESSTGDGDDGPAAPLETGDAPEAANTEAPN